MSKLYIPISKGPYLKKEGNWIRENPLCDLTFDELLKDLIDGQYNDEIVSIIEVDLTAGTSKEAGSALARIWPNGWRIAGSRCLRAGENADAPVLATCLVLSHRRGRHARPD
jgi:hypothetical protein